METSALKRTGLKEVVEKAVKLAKANRAQVPDKIFADDVEAAVDEIEGCLPDSVPEVQKRWFAVKLLEKDEKVNVQLALPASARSTVDAVVKRVETAHDDDTESIITNERLRIHN